MGFFKRLLSPTTTNHTAPQQHEFEKNPLFTEHPDAVMVLNKAHQIIYMNEQASSLLGYSLENRSLSIEKWMSPDRYKRMSSTIQQAFKDQTSSFEATFLHKTGYEIPVKITLINYETDTIICICQDLRPLKGYKNQISNLYDNLLFIQKVTNIGSFNYDVFQDQSFWPNQTYEIFGVDDSDFVPCWQTVTALIHPNDFSNY
ncbi:PAS domain-containing protein [Bacillus tuaregi]|uniref:PAS domain-containing protein n=1 Tax=Bacillus tuaregi TaxID=1816695 RepID=UPI0008F8F4D0|nr:PAS domain-containing protein [Bacillus tuaregi]